MTREAVQTLQQNISTSIIGQEYVVSRLILGLLCNGNILMEGLPGLGKTRAIKTLATHLESQFSRIQFTPDLLPSDITGSEVYLGEQAQERFSFQPGPIFSNLVLADEINRSPAKVQAALLEAMEERQVTVAGTTHAMPALFMVLATQNPIEQEGTYPLPEAQMDRFLMHIVIDYPDQAAERQIMRLVREESGTAQKPPVVQTTSQEHIFAARDAIDQVELTDSMEEYIVSLIAASRRPAEYSEELDRWLVAGASPRGTLALDKTARAHAWLQGRDTVLPDDVRAVVHDCLRHRLTLSYEAHADGITADRVVKELVTQVALPG